MRENRTSHIITTTITTTHPMEGLLLSRATAGASGGNGSGGGAGGVIGINSVTLGSRSSSASSAERSLLLGALATHMGVLDARENDAQTIIRKSELWDEITRQFNAHTLAPRSRQQIQTLYKNMKAKARRYEARLAEVASGVPPPDPDPISEMLLGLLHQQMQHQRRHLQRLAVLDNYSHAHTPPTQTPTTDDTGKTFNMDGPILTPEQVMQVSLEEGLATDIDVKDEPHDSGVVASPKKREEEEAEGEEEEEEEQESSSTLFSESVFAPLRPGVPTSSPHQQGVAATGTVATSLQDQLQDQQQPPQGTIQRLPTSSSAGPSLTSSLRLHNTGVPSSTNLQTPSKAPINLQFQASYLPQTAAHALTFSRSALETNSAIDHLSSTAKRPKLDTMGDVGRIRGCGGGMSSRLSSSHCCCPDLHASLAAQAEQEHQQRMKVLMEESQARAEEHSIRMRILALEEELLRTRLGTAGREREGKEGRKDTPDRGTDGVDAAGDEYNV